MTDHRTRNPHWKPSPRTHPAPAHETFPRLPQETVGCPWKNRFRTAERGLRWSETRTPLQPGWGGPRRPEGSGTGSGWRTGGAPARHRLRRSRRGCGGWSRQVRRSPRRRWNSRVWSCPWGSWISSAWRLASTVRFGWSCSLSWWLTPFVRERENSSESRKWEWAGEGWRTILNWIELRSGLEWLNCPREYIYYNSPRGLIGQQTKNIES